MIDHTDGVWVRLRNPACKVWVEDTEVAWAHEHAHSARTYMEIAHNIAIGIRCRSYSLPADERLARIRAV